MEKQEAKARLMEQRDFMKDATAGSEVRGGACPVARQRDLVNQLTTNMSCDSPAPWRASVRQP